MPRSRLARRIAWPNAISAGSFACFGDEIGIAECSAYDANCTTDDLPHIKYMFRVDEPFRLKSAPSLEGVDCAGHFHVVQIVGNRPVWLVHALTAPLDDGMRWWKKVLADHASSALSFISLDGWYVKDLYVLVPPYLCPENGLHFARCNRIVECLEPDASDRCWRVELSEFTFLDSGYGTALGEELPLRVVWTADRESLPPSA